MRSIAFLLTPGFDLLGLGAAIAFQTANDVASSPIYSIAFMSEQGGLVRSASGLVVETERLSHSRRDTLFCIGTAFPIAPSSGVISFLQRANALSRRMVASSNATFYLAAAGLLDGKRATTHWEYIPEFQRCYPGVRVEPDRIFVTDGDIWTSAGMSAALDLALALIEDDSGLSVSCEVAKQLVLYYRRPGEQSQISTLIDLAPRTDRIRRVLSYARAHLRNELSIEELAEIAHLSPRHFSRLFRQETGQSPAKAVEALRVEAARTMLMDRRASLEAIAVEAGFADRGRMRRAFMRAMGESPISLEDTGARRLFVSEIAA